jgi:hypothetical protein
VHAYCRDGSPRGADLGSQQRDLVLTTWEAVGMVTDLAYDDLDSAAVNPRDMPTPV